MSLGVKRLTREYRQLLAQPLPQILTHPLEDNLFEWHYVLTPDEKPYQDGVYWGKLVFPEEYPLKPPAIYMLTPSGRFAVNEKLCLSISDFHVESWNPSWSVGTILLGVLSFMLSDEMTTGSIQQSFSEREKLAQESLTWNFKQEIFQNLFEKENFQSLAENKNLKFQSSNFKIQSANENLKTLDSNENLKNQSSNETLKSSNETLKSSNETLESDLKKCRYCFETELESEEELISPCQCKGSNQWVHLSCLRKWQRTTVLSQSTHPKHQKAIEQICNVCFSEYQIKTADRHQIMLSFTGAEIAQLLRASSLIVSDESASNYNLALMDKEKNLKDRLAHWTQGIYFIFRVDHSLEVGKPGSNHDCLMAVDLTRPITDPKLWPDMTRWSLDPRISIHFFTGGPVAPKQMTGLMVFRGGKEQLPWSLNEQLFQLISPIFDNDDQEYTLVFGPFEAMIQLAHLVFKNKESLQKLSMYVYLGMAGWDRTQLLGEISRGGWGMCQSRFDDVWPYQSQKWSELISSDRLLFSSKNEFSEDYQQALEKFKLKN